MCVCGPCRGGKKREEKLGKAKGEEIKALSSRNGEVWLKSHLGP